MDTRNRITPWASSLSFAGCQCSDDVPVEVWRRDARHILNGVESYNLWAEYQYRCQKCGATLHRLNGAQPTPPAPTHTDLMVSPESLSEYDGIVPRSKATPPTVPPAKETQP